MSKSHNLTPQHKKLLQAVDEILFWKWDPIGVSSLIDSEVLYWPRGEYASYVGPIFSKLIASDITVEELANHLGQITIKQMGLSAVPEHDKQIAEMLIMLANNGDKVS